MAEKISIRSNDHHTHPIIVHTSRGEIAASHVIHATDSFASNLIPGLKGKLFPLRGHMSAQRPGTAFPKLNGSRSWSLIGKRGFEYITQRPDSHDEEDNLANALMAGGGVVQSEHRGLDEFGIWRDDQTSAPISAYLGGILPVAFGPENWGDDRTPSRLIQLWTGCMGFTMDLLPYVGRLDGRLTGRPLPPSSSSSPETGAAAAPPPAEWISAGFNGEGMVSAWLSGVAVGLMVLGREADLPSNACGRPAGIVDTWFPEELQCSIGRVDRASIYDLARWI